MSHRPWMPLYVQDFILDTLDLEPDELGVYFRLVCLAWRHGDGGVPADMNELKRILQCSFSKFHGLTFNRIVPKLLDRYFELRGPFYYQKRVENELRKARELSKNQSRIAKKRWSKTKENNDLVDAMAMPLQSQSHPPINQGGFMGGDPHTENRARATRLPTGWMPNFAGRCFAIDNGLSQAEADRELERFRNHWTAKAGRDATKFDWDATWRNWVLKAGDMRRPSNGTGTTKTAGDRARELAEQIRAEERARGIGRPPDPVGSC